MIHYIFMPLLRATLAVLFTVSLPIALWFFLCALG
jgi:hypothetical protein